MIYCKKQNIEIMFDDENGSLYSLKENQTEYVKEKVDIFKLAFRNNIGKQILLDSGNMSLISSESSTTGFVCEYTASDVTVKINCDISDGIEWGVAVSPAKDLVCEWVKYPLIAVNNDFADHGGNSKLLWGFNE